MVEYTLDKGKHESKKYSNLDPIDAFLSGIASILKSLSPYYHLARGGIFIIIDELEFKQLENENLSRCLTPETFSASQLPNEYLVQIPLILTKLTSTTPTSAMLSKSAIINLFS